MNLEELCSWLSHQKGMMPQMYAKDLAKYIVRTKQQADRIAELEDRLSMYEIKDLDKPQIKELSDEEINETAQQCWVYPQGEQAIFNQHKFARAILKKASAK